MGESEALHPYLTREAAPAEPEPGLSDVAQELLLPLHDQGDSNHGYIERHQAALVGRGALGAQHDG